MNEEGDIYCLFGPQDPRQAKPTLIKIAWFACVIDTGDQSMLRPNGDQGEGALSYLAVILLIATVAAAVTVVAIPDQVASGVKAAICRVVGDEDCAHDDRPESGSSNAGTPNPSGSPGAPGASSAPPAVPGSPEQDAYDRARGAAVAAEDEVKAAEADFGRLRGELWDFLLDLVGYKQAEKCLKEVDILACIETLATAIPWGKAFKVLKKIPGAIKLAKRLKQVWDRAAAARKKRDGAQRAARKAEDDLRKRKQRDLAVCRVGGRGSNSFLAGTPVLLADRRHEAIEDVNIGDQVWATDPVTGRGGARRVTDVITGHGRKDLVDVIVAPASPGSPTAKVTATRAHPFWAGPSRGWADADDLVAGDRLITPAGASATVVASRRQAPKVERVYNLTVADVHTYYVQVGATDILAHNEEECDPIPNNRSEFEQRQEVKAAAERGVRPVALTPGSGMEGLKQVLKGATDFKWAIVPDGRGGMELRVMPAYWRRTSPGDPPDIELAHTVLSGVNGKVYAAGSGNFMGDMLFINNHSGHFKPGASTLPLGEEFFRRAGIPSTAIPAPGS